MRYLLLLISFCFVLIGSCKKNNTDPEETPRQLNISYVYIGETALTQSGDNKDIATDANIEIRFSQPVNKVSAEENIYLLDESNQKVDLVFSFLDQDKLLNIGHLVLAENTSYTLKISGDLIGENNETFEEQVYYFITFTTPLILEKILIDESEINPALRIKDISRNPKIDFHFNLPVTITDLDLYSSFMLNGTSVAYTLNQVDDKTISLKANQSLEGYVKYQFTISSGITNRIERPFNGLDLYFYTQLDSTPRFPDLTEDELLTKIQQQTFKYFWDFGHPVSGLTRERNTSGETVTSGGSGFGIMAILIGIERGFITRANGLERLQIIVDFLTAADRFHGAWPHWLNGTTGKVIPFSQEDDGGDLVETSYLAAGLLSARQYLDPGIPDENTLINKINNLWNSIEWDWYTKNGENVLYWHWSPNYDWQMNMKIQGYNEALITYIMAASSETHTIDAAVYHQGWAKSGAINNGNTFYEITLPLGQDYGGPLFFAHYSFLGINPTNLSDNYANYWQQNVNHSLINRAYCNANPKNYISYSTDCWGLTASDGNTGYSAHSPTNDKGVIAPTAAVSSIPYTPVESMKAIKFFYYQLGDKLWGEYGFYDAFNITEGWTANSFLAIDQGPIIIMIENYRTGLIWNLLMSCPEVQQGLTKLGFTY